MKPRSKLTRSVGALVLLVIGIVLYVIFPFLELAEKWETARELAKHIPEFVKSTWFGPVIFLGGLAILTYEKWMAAFHRLIGREPEGEGTDKPQLPNLQLDIEEAQVFAKMQFINKQNQTWLFRCNLVVKLHVVNTTSIPCTVRRKTSLGLFRGQRLQWNLAEAPGRVSLQFLAVVQLVCREALCLVGFRLPKSTSGGFDLFLSEFGK
jgi:hypothetical protein